MSQGGSGGQDPHAARRTSRRRFVAGAIGGLAVGAAAGAALGSVAFPRATPSDLVLDIPSRWDYTADVVVVGAGGAGLSAALGALEAGARVIVLEKSPEVGGTTALSTSGGMWIPNNSLSVAAGQTEDVSQLLEYCNNCGEGQQDEELMSAYFQQGPGWVDHLMQATRLTFSLQTQWGDFYNVPGGQQVVHWIGPSGGGVGLVSALKSAVDGNGATTMLSTAATALYKDATGRIVGLRASPVPSPSASTSASMEIQARKGVILCAGGMDWNQEMLLNYMRGPIDTSSAPQTLTGDGILMAMAAGAWMHNMNNAWGWPTYITPTGNVPDVPQYRGKPGAIVVNRLGKRFANESSAYPVFNRAFHVWDTESFDYINHPAYVIMDSACFGRYGLAGASPSASLPGYISTASALGGLAATLGVDPAGLQATVTRFNAYATNGVDPDFHRGAWFFDQNTAGDPTRTDLKNDCLAPIQAPPFYGVEIHPGITGTCGGPRINPKGQILDQAGDPVPGLYGAGNDVASAFGAAYPAGGATIGLATFFGWTAGTAAGSS